MDVFVVDDDPAYRELLVLAARECGAGSVRDFPDGEHALAHVVATPAAPALFVIDLHMPRLSGVQLVARIRALCPSALVAVLSAAAAEQERQAMLDAGAMLVLQKPTGWNCIVDCLRRLLGAARQAARSSGSGPTNSPVGPGG